MEMGEVDGSKVSIVVAVYNVSPYVEECVRSLFGQTLEGMEYIFVDDASTDGSMDIVERVLEEYPNRKAQVKVLRHEQNQGVAATKNQGIRSATGEYLIIVDPDDYVELNMMEEMYGKAVESNSDMVICDYYRFTSKGFEVSSMVPDGVVNNGENVRDDILNMRFASFCCMKLFRRSLFSGDDVIWPVGRFAEDVVYSAVTAYKAKKIVHVPLPLYHYRANESSLTHAIDEEGSIRNYQGFVANVSLRADYLEKLGLAEKYWKGILIQKVRARNRILPLAGQWRYRKMWFDTYSELNKVLFWGDSNYHSSYREKVWYVAVMAGLYPLLKKRLGGKHLRPFPQWPVW